jgi:hypothetical protein
VRWDACTFLAPHLRLAGGASLFELQLDGNNFQESDSAVSGFGSLGAGFLLHTPARSFETRSGKYASLSFGLLLEGGYALRSPVDFALRTVRDQRAIDVVNARLGRLDLSGPYIRTSLVVRF